MRGRFARLARAISVAERAVGIITWGRWCVGN